MRRDTGNTLRSAGISEICWPSTLTFPPVRLLLLQYGSDHIGSSRSREDPPVSTSILLNNVHFRVSLRGKSTSYQEKDLAIIYHVETRLAVLYLVFESIIVLLIVSHPGEKSRPSAPAQYNRLVGSRIDELVLFGGAHPKCVCVAASYFTAYAVRSIANVSQK
ncbi:hypothetical protein F5Y15DRAFT_356030 [Xylariaceae sp. FL0016]|nr:hypothetical protein F5Y15DRAFT_356030 [Xylariaceae sp. FL0016]